MGFMDNKNWYSSHPWWLMMLEGIVAFVLGVLLVANTEQTVTMLLAFLGIYLLVIGILHLVQLFKKPQHWGWKLVASILAIIVGLFIIANRFLLTPVTPLILAYGAAAVVILDGLVHIIAAFRAPSDEGQSYGSPVLGGFELIFGILLLFIPHLTASVIYVTVALGAIIGGIVLFLYSFSLRKKAKE